MDLYKVDFRFKETVPSCSGSSVFLSLAPCQFWHPLVLGAKVFIQQKENWSTSTVGLAVAWRIVLYRMNLANLPAPVEEVQIVEIMDNSIEQNGLPSVLYQVIDKLQKPSGDAESLQPHNYMGNPAR